MFTGFDIQLPFKEPVIIFLVLFLIIFIAPRVLKYLRIPGIVGFIIAGLLIGPHGFGLVAREGGIELFSTFGLLYIMFLVGLEIDIVDFRKNRQKSIVFGGLTFILPLVSGFLVCRYLLDLNFPAALLLASMFSTHTLISYPIVNKLGLTRHRLTNIVVGGTIVTDTAVLLLMAVIINTMHGKPDALFWIRIVGSLALLAFIMLWVVPLVSRWLFKKLAGNVEGEYIVLLLMLFFAGCIAKMAGVEPMIGAFLAGLALNKLVPYSSTLMKRTIFVGNTIFIPIFLISVGMVVDMNVFFQGMDALKITLVLIVTALITKYLAAWATQLIFKYRQVDRNYIFGLSASHAAATIALVLIGFNVGLFDVKILNGTIAVIFISCLVSSFFTENAGKKIAILSHKDNADNKDQEQRILVPVANPATMSNLINFSILIKNPASAEPIYPLSVIIGTIDSDEAKSQILSVNKTVETILNESRKAGTGIFPVTRVDMNVASGINRAIKELMITQVVIGWNGKYTTANYIFTNIIEGILPRNNQMIVVAKLQKAYSSYRRIVVMMPPNAEYEMGFVSWLKMIAVLSKQLSLKVLFLGLDPCIIQSQKAIEKFRVSIMAEYKILKEINELNGIEKFYDNNDFAVFVSARPRTLSHSSYTASLPRNTSKKFPNNDFIIIYPEQVGNTQSPVADTIDGLKSSPIAENLERFGKIRKRIGRIGRKKSNDQD
jgi:Kef-type K+ transport system membrane component KefB